VPPQAVPVAQQDRPHQFRGQARGALPPRDRQAVVVDQHRLDLRVGPQLLDQRIRQWDPRDLGRPRLRDRDDEHRLRRQRRRLELLGHVDCVAHPDQRVDVAMLPTLPPLTRRGFHGLGQPVDGRLDPGAQHIRQLPVDLQHGRAPVSTTSATTARRTVAASPPPSASTGCAPGGPDPPAPCSGPAPPTPHHCPRRRGGPPTPAARRSGPPHARPPPPPAATRAPAPSPPSRASTASTRRRARPRSRRSAHARRAPARS
jgi:hypothetical protein